MEFEKKIKYSIDNWVDFQDDEDIEFAKARVQFLSTKPNSHHHVYSEEVLKEYAPSIIGKWLTAEYIDGDTSTHTSNQKILGIFPTQEVIFEYDEEGYLTASADAIISKLYATDVYLLFKDNNFRSVSVEMLSGFTDETKNYEDGGLDKIVVGFEILACTVLGLKYNPSIPEANITITQFSEDNVKIALQKYNELQKDDNIQKTILSKLCDIENKLDRKETEMDNENKITDVIVEEKLAEPVIENEMAVIPDEEEKMEDTPENDDKEDEEMAKLKTKCEDLETKLADQEVELSELRSFKAQYDEMQKQNIIDTTMEKAKELVDGTDFAESKFTEFSNKAKECKFEELGHWKSDVIAECAMYAIENKKATPNTSKDFDMGVVVEQKENKTIYDY